MRFLLALAFLSVSALAQSPGDVLLSVKGASGPLVPTWVTKTSSRALGWNSDGTLTAIPVTSSVAWADITGKPSEFTPAAHTQAISTITGLQTALDAKASTSALSSYLTTATAATTYAPLASPTFTGTVTIPSGASISGYLTTATAASTYAPLASPTLTGTIQLTGTVNATGSYFQYARNGSIVALLESGLSVLRSGFGYGSALVFPGRNGSLRNYHLPDIDATNVTLLDTTTAAATYLTSATAASAYQPLDDDLTAISELTTTSFGRSLLSLNSASFPSSVHIVANDNVAASLVISSAISSVASLTNENITAPRQYQVPDASGTLALTSQTDGSISASDVAGLAASAITDTTNASNITSGTLNLARIGDASITGAKLATSYLPSAGGTATGLLQFGGGGHAGIRLNNLTTTQRDALTGAAGMVIWNTTDGRMQLHNGTSWTSGMVRLSGDTMTGNLTVPIVYPNQTATRPQFALSTATTTGIGVASDRVEAWVAGSVVANFVAGEWQPGSANINWGSNTRLYGNSDGTGRLVQRNGTSPQTFSIANTYTSFTNKEEFEIGWVGNSNVCRLRPIKGSGGGTSRNAEFHTTETGVNWGSGSGSPEGVRTAPVGSLYTRTDGGANTTLYVKESGTGNTGWVAK